MLLSERQAKRVLWGERCTYKKIKKFTPVLHMILLHCLGSLVCVYACIFIIVSSGSTGDRKTDGCCAYPEVLRGGGEAHTSIPLPINNLHVYYNTQPTIIFLKSEILNE